MKPEAKVKAIPLTIEDEILSCSNKAGRIYFIRKSNKRNVIIACAVSIFLIILAVSLLLILSKDVPVKNIKTHIGIIAFDPLPALPAPVKKPDCQADIRKPEVITKNNIASAKKANVPAADNMINTSQTYDTQKDKLGGIDQFFFEYGAESIAEKQHLWVEGMSQNIEKDSKSQSINTANMIYPEIAVSASTQGKALVTFMIEKDGTISHIKIVKGPGDSSDEVAFRVKLILDKCKGGI